MEIEKGRKCYTQAVKIFQRSILHLCILDYSFARSSSLPRCLRVMFQEVRKCNFYLLCNLKPIFSSINELGGFEMELNQPVLWTGFPMLMSEGRTTRL